MDATQVETNALSAVFDARRANLRLLASKHESISGLAAKLHMRHPSYLSQLIGPNPQRNVSERTARAFETRLGLPAGWLDLARG
ncbi:hypothetical protein [Cupriavidus sp. CuC1]|uniref:hypothetical protein n=1 Tax=Cupriavidus sp. CuC1 TaxID=3373131 RepID=UPI0037D8D703